MEKVDICFAVFTGSLFLTAGLLFSFDSYMNSKVVIECLKQNPNNAIVCKDIS